MAEITVREFATVLKVPVERLLAQLADAGLVGKQAEAIINEQEKSQLLAHLRRLHGKDSAAPEVTKITLSRKTVSEIKIPADKTKTRSRLVKPGVAAKTVAVVVPSPAMSLVLPATSFTISAPMFSNLSLNEISFAIVTPSFVMCGPP